MQFLQDIQELVRFYWGLTPQQQPGSYQGGEMMMMMESVFWWRKPEYPEETTDLRQVTDETFHTYSLCPVRGLNLGRSGVKQSELRRTVVWSNMIFKKSHDHFRSLSQLYVLPNKNLLFRNNYQGSAHQHTIHVYFTLVLNYKHLIHFKSKLKNTQI